jgi:hypothetical protein
MLVLRVGGMECHSSEWKKPCWYKEWLGWNVVLVIVGWKSLKNKIKQSDVK